MKQPLFPVKSMCLLNFSCSGLHGPGQVGDLGKRGRDTTMECSGAPETPALAADLLLRVGSSVARPPCVAASSAFACPAPFTAGRGFGSPYRLTAQYAVSPIQ